MPYHINWEEKGAYRRFAGEISSIEILKSNFELHSHPRFLKISYVINDFTEIIGHSLTPYHTDVYAKTDEGISVSVGTIKIGLVVTDEDKAIAESYIDQMADKTFECKLFMTLEEAYSWVGKS